MSDRFIDIIPVDPAFVPTEPARQLVVVLAGRLLPKAEAIELEVDDQVVFRDCGANFESVQCPACGEDLTEAWGELMERDFDGHGFSLQAYELECCGAASSLAELDYVPPQGFSRTVLRLRNPDVAEVSESALDALARELGVPLRPIYRQL